MTAPELDRPTADPKTHAPEVPQGGFEDEFGLESNAARRAASAGKPPVDTVVEPEPEEELEAEGGEEGEGEEEQEAKPEEEGEGEKEEGEGEGEGSDEDITVQSLDSTEAQALLDELLTHPAAENLTFAVKRDNQIEQLSLAELKRDAAGYVGQERVGDMAKQLRQEQELLTKEREQFAKNINDPKHFFDFIEEYADDPLEYFQTLASLSAGYIDEWSGQPSSYRRHRRETANSRTLLSIAERLEKLEKGGTRKTEPEDATSAPRGEPAVGHDGLTDAQRQVAQQRATLVQKFGFDVGEVGEAYAKAGRPTDFEGWFATYTKAQRDGARAVQDKENERKRHGPAVRQGPRRRTEPTRGRPSNTWPSVQDIEAEIAAARRKK